MEKPYFTFFCTLCDVLSRCIAFDFSAGREMSRSEASRSLGHGTSVKNALEKRGIIVKAGNTKLLSEEASDAYKDVTKVVILFSTEAV